MSRMAAQLLVVALLATACAGTATDSTTSSPAATAPTSTTSTTSQTSMPQSVSFETADGLTLEGAVFGDGADWVVLAHMRPASMQSWFPFAEVLEAAGYTALAFDFRGYGGSEGAGFAVDTDVIAAVDYATRSGAQTVSVVGASMGGTGAIAAAADRDLAAVVTLSAPLAFEGVDGTAAMGTVTAPTLLIAAEDDQPYAAAIGDYAAASVTPVNTLFLSGDAHGTDLFADHAAELTDQILAHLASGVR